MGTLFSTPNSINHDDGNDLTSGGYHEHENIENDAADSSNGNSAHINNNSTSGARRGSEDEQEADYREYIWMRRDVSSNAAAIATPNASASDNENINVSNHAEHTNNNNADHQISTSENCDNDNMANTGVAVAIAVSATRDTRREELFDSANHQEPVLETMERSAVSDENNSNFVSESSHGYEWMVRNNFSTLMFGHLKDPIPVLATLSSEQEESRLSCSLVARGKIGGTVVRYTDIKPVPPYRPKHENYKLKLWMRGQNQGEDYERKLRMREHNPSDLACVTNTMVINRSSRSIHVGRPRPAVPQSIRLSSRLGGHEGGDGPNVAFSIFARETTGRLTGGKNHKIPPLRRLQTMSGKSLVENKVNRHTTGMCNITSSLSSALDVGDWSEVSRLVTLLTPKLIGDQHSMQHHSQQQQSSDNHQNDPSLPPNASPIYAGGGRTGLERDAFVQSGGVDMFVQIFRKKEFVGEKCAESNNARDVSRLLVESKFSDCWKQILISLRELVYSIPELVEDDNSPLLDGGLFLPFLFTLLAHKSCFDSAAALIEEILSLQSQSPLVRSASVGSESGDLMSLPLSSSQMPSSIFFLGDVPDLYKLWGGFTCRQLAHFCRILALLVFEPEDRQLLESPAVLKSVELLKLRRFRSARAGKDVVVERNQSLLLGDDNLMVKFIQLLKIMNFAPELRRGVPYHIMAHFPWIADTLMMLGLSELESWDDLDRLERTARKVIPSSSDSCVCNDSNQTNVAISQDQAIEFDEYSNLRCSCSKRNLSELGTVSIMLENLSENLLQNGNIIGNGLAGAHLGQIIHVINAAQLHRVIVGRSRQAQEDARRQQNTGSSIEGASSSFSMDDVERESNERRGQRDRNNRFMNNSERVSETQNQIPVAVPVDIDDENDSIDDGALSMASRAMDQQVRYRRRYAPTTENEIGIEVETMGVSVGDRDASEDQPAYHAHASGRTRHKINFPLDAANELQLNALILSPYQVEILFVLCTLLGGRRKIDVQETLAHLGLVNVLEDMFDRLSLGPTRQSSNNDNRSQNMASNSSTDDEQNVGIHGPGCDCNPESALRVQYLRLLHNFCDRDCDNYVGRRLLLSPSEREFIFGEASRKNNIKLKDGLMTKVINAFRREPEDSPYRFWLASCAESWIRGSSQKEQSFAAKSGLLRFLVNYVLSDKLHSAGSLQTAFDLLGELCKGNTETLRMLLSCLDGDNFHKLMNVAVCNLVDSNVFIRALLLSTERIVGEDSHEEKPPLDEIDDKYAKNSRVSCGWLSETGTSSRSYLTHSWWEISYLTKSPVIEEEQSIESMAPLGISISAFPELEHSSSAKNNYQLCIQDEEKYDSERSSDWFHSFSHVGQKVSHQWPKSNITLNNFPLDLNNVYIEESEWKFNPFGLSTFMVHGNGLIDNSSLRPNTLENLVWFLLINQACLLRDLLNVVNLENVNHENICCLNTAILVTVFAYRRGQLADLLFVLRTMSRHESLQKEKEKQFFSSRGGFQKLQDGKGVDRDMLLNYRELLWFWLEYYTHRGRDRLSLEFSSHLRFQEWKHVVNLLCADNGEETCLIPRPVNLPRSPSTIIPS